MESKNTSEIVYSQFYGVYTQTRQDLINILGDYKENYISHDVSSRPETVPLMQITCPHCECVYIYRTINDIPHETTPNCSCGNFTPIFIVHASHEENKE